MPTNEPVVFSHHPRLLGDAADEPFLVAPSGASVVDAILRDSGSAAVRLDRRAGGRRPYAQVIHLMPLDRQLRPVDERPIQVVGREISADGLGFYHTQPIAHRFVIAEFSAGARPCPQVILKLAWCRFLREGWYDSGGQFLEWLTLPQTSRAG